MPIEINERTVAEALRELERMADESDLHRNLEKAISGNYGLIRKLLGKGFSRAMICRHLEESLQMEIPIHTFYNFLSRAKKKAEPEKGHVADISGAEDRQEEELEAMPEEKAIDIELWTNRDL